MQRSRTILYAEDDPVVRTAHQTHLRQSGFHVIPARDGLEAIKRLSVLIPDLVLLDLMLPKFTGEEVLQYMGASSALEKVPVIILATNSVGNVAQEEWLERASQRLLKSQCTGGILLAAIRDALAAAAWKTAALPLK
jgi:CheY-like chemotaxis protein